MEISNVDEDVQLSCFVNMCKVSAKFHEKFACRM